MGGGIVSIEVEDGCAAYKSVGGVVYSKDGSTLVAAPAALSCENDVFAVAQGTIAVAAYAFSGIGTGDSSAITVVLPESACELGEASFTCASVAQINLPAGISEIPRRCFSETQLKDVTIPGTVKVIGNEAFTNSSVVNVILESDVQSVGKCAFFNCSILASFTLPSTVTSLHATSLANTDELRDVTIVQGSPYSISANGCLLTDGGKTLIGTVEKDLWQSYEYVVPDGVEALADNALCQIESVVRLPSTVAQVGEEAIGYSCSNAASTSPIEGTVVICPSPSEGLVKYAKANRVPSTPRRPTAR
ncbi:leucine-rich repeat domain-containing protein [Paratractidigestivibacter sp.]|uniref:leucine-rich repeat domain-containing protein n=1 Tax=Paratractidigestivibacter sp. TaxID=2847316 RepID=UPI002ACB128C|nr:leucine-rich repeat domain-containing protein [Paratractidigestivibacter sp.]